MSEEKEFLKKHRIKDALLKESPTDINQHIYLSNVLEAYNQEQIKWIWVGDKTPYYGQRVLIQYGNTKIAKYLDKPVSKNTHEKQKFFIQNNIGKWKHVTVFHWQPVP